MGTTAIPLDDIVQMLPAVIGATGTPGRLTGLVLTEDASIYGSQDFTSADDIRAWFGAGTPQDVIGQAYFPGVVNGGQLPYDLRFVKYASTAQAAALVGANLDALTLVELQALSGTLSLTVNGTLETSGTISLAAATSFANAATIIQAGFTSPVFAVSYDALRNRFIFTSNTTGALSTITAATGTLSTSLGLTVTAGASVNQGLDVQTLGEAMDAAVAISTNWALFGTDWMATITERTALGTWNSGQNYKYLYVANDLDGASIVANNAASYGAIAFATPVQGTLPVYGDQNELGAIMGWAAAIDFQNTEGRSNLMFRQFNAGIAPRVTSRTIANNLRSNNYSFIGGYANAANTWTIVVNGAVSGKFLWADTYVDQIYLNAEMQMAQFQALLAYGSMPYNSDGYTRLYRAGVDVITAALASGIIRAGVTLSQTELQQIDTAAGVSGAGLTVQTRGWYLLIKDPSSPATARTTRTSPYWALWYSDGGSIQKIDANSTAVI